MATSYSVKQPYLRNHKTHDFQKSLEFEKNIIQRGDHLPVIHALNSTLEEKWGLSIDYDSFEDNYGNDSTSQFKNRAGVDASFDLVDVSTRKVKQKGFTIDYKFRNPEENWNDFLAEIVSQDFGEYSNRMPVPGWAICKHKINDAILYILPYHKKAALIMRSELKDGFYKGRFRTTNSAGKDLRTFAKNKGWTTISLPIDWKRLTKVCPTTMIFKYE
tara:strand:- start:118 stop:768 length:651 start_codon:yes stop_codon:yes gene_type:complete